MADYAVYFSAREGRIAFVLKMGETRVLPEALETTDERVAKALRGK